jgi:ribosomal protein L34
MLLRVAATYMPSIATKRHSREQGHHAQMKRANNGPKLVGARRVCRRAPLSYQPAYKPGFVGCTSKLVHVTTIPLGRRLPDASSNLPGRPDPDIDPGDCSPRRPYSVLLPVGFTVPLPLPSARCALTAPFHPCRAYATRRGGLFSVALSLGSPPPDVIRHRMSVEPGLSSRTTFRHWSARSSGRLTP